MKHLLHFKTLFAVMLMLFCVNGAWAQNTVTITKDFKGISFPKNGIVDLGDGLVLTLKGCNPAEGF